MSGRSWPVAALTLGLCMTLLRTGLLYVEVRESSRAAESLDRRLPGSWLAQVEDRGEHPRPAGRPAEPGSDRDDLAGGGQRGLSHRPGHWARTGENR